MNRTPTRRVARRALTRAVGIWAALASGCAAPVDQLEPPGGTPDPAAAGTTVRGPDGRDLRVVELPDFTAMDAPVRAQMEAAHAVLATRIDAGAPPAALGAAYGTMGQLLMAATHFDAAEACLGNAQTLTPDDGRWPYYLGQLYRVTGALEGAVTAFERAVALDPDNVAALIWLGEVHLAQGRHEAAGSRFDTALSRSPDSAAARFGAGRVALAQDDHAAAVRELERALAAAPGATRIHYALGMAYRGLGDLERAQLHLARQGDIDPRPVDPLMRELDELLASPEAFDVRGGRALDEGSWTLAAELFRRGLELDPDNASLRHRLGTALFQLGDPQGAETQFAAVIERSPEHTRAQFSLGVLMAASGRLDAAIDRFGAALAYDAGYVQARLQLAAALVHRTRAAEAIEHYERALDLDPTLEEAELGRAMAMVRLHRFADARDRLADGMALFPDQPAFAHALARVLAAAPDDRVRDGARARALVEGLLEKDQSIDLGETIAMTLAELGEYGQAAAVQRDVMAAARQAGLDDVVARMAVNLRLYERGEPCRVPWVESELP